MSATAGLATCAQMLDTFLAGDARVRFVAHAEPLVTVILVLRNRAELTLRCLRSLEQDASVPLELIVVDNASSDETKRLLQRCDGIVVIGNDDNLGFPVAVNQAARRARAPYLLILNNDTELLPGSLAAALRTITMCPDVGAVGGKIIQMDGRLQEAGSIVWSDGSSLGYGRGDAPFSPAYMFRRDVDYCSAVFLLTRRDLFLGAGGFDERYTPAYYEDVDYCFRLWNSGHRVVYEPMAIVRHVEFASSGSMTRAVELQTSHRALFVSTHQDRLARQSPSRLNRLLAARAVACQGSRILFIDDRVPHQSLGAGYPRSREMILALDRLGHFVTMYPLIVAGETWESVYADIPRTVEVMIGSGADGLAALLQERSQYFDWIIVSRPWNMRFVRSLLEANPDLLGDAGLIYDAEAIMSERDGALRRFQGENVPDLMVKQALEDELALAQRVDAVIAVSEDERERFVDAGCAPIFLLRHPVDAKPTPAPFAERDGFLFVGAIHQDSSPNADCVVWFVSEILPLIRERLGIEVPLTVVGVNASERVARLAGARVTLLGRLDDLEAVYGRARIFIAPTRFAAGIPLKMIDAAGHGVPIVCTPLVASQLRWRDRVEVLTAGEPVTFAERCAELYRDPVLWETLRAGALRRVEEQCSHQTFEETLDALVGQPRRASTASEREVREIRKALLSARREADALRASLSWRITAPARRIQDSLLWLRGLRP